MRAHVFTSKLASGLLLDCAQCTRFGFTISPEPSLLVRCLPQPRAGVTHSDKNSDKPARYNR